jgi:hypothetical protein
MRLLCQFIALRANGEEGQGLGRFWQSRFKAVRILDEESLLACAAYVDLNPIRAALAATLEASDYTSVQPRITSLKENVAAINNSNAVNSARITNRADDLLSPISIDEKNDPLSSRPSRNGKRCRDKGFIDGRMSSSLPTIRSKPDSKSQWICVIPARFLPLAPCFRGEGVGG